MSAHEMIWDGITYRVVPKAEAAALESADKCQRMSRGLIAAHELKRRSEFKGYDRVTNPEPQVMAQPEPQVMEKAAPPQPEEPAVIKPETAPASKAVKSAPMKSWLSYRGLAAKALGKPVNRVTKADVARYLETTEDIDPTA